MHAMILQPSGTVGLAASGSLLAAAAAASGVFALAGWVGRRRPAPEEGFEERRRALLRQANSTYRSAEPLVDRLAACRWLRMSAAEQRLAREIPASGDPLPWKPAEYVALRQIEGAMVGGVIGFVVAYLSRNPLLGLLVGAAASWLTAVVLLRGVADRVRRRLGELKARLPFAIDLMALMMQSGANFREALEEAVREAQGSPLAEELGEVLRQTNQGVGRREALLGLQQRLQDETVSELVFAVVKGEEMGTPLAALLRDRAEQMRLRQSQESEKRAGEAQVKILFPTMVIMVGCMLIIVAPFLLNAVYQGTTSGGMF